MAQVSIHIHLLVVQQVMIVVDGTEVLDVHGFAGVVFVVFVPHGEPAFFADVAFYVYVTLSYF